MKILVVCDHAAELVKLRRRYFPGVDPEHFMPISTEADLAEAPPHSLVVYLAGPLDLFHALLRGPHDGYPIVVLERDSL